ncbi:hypothetical protein N7461_003694 [Penicillium sp. DV-2018c]|nr:hypothetical protein N7461_003694 [Penicillium sp. DV-2018c]
MGLEQKRRPLQTDAIKLLNARGASAQPSLEKPLPTWLDELNTWRVKSLPGEPKLSTLRKALTKQALPMKVGCWTL